MKKTIAWSTGSCIACSNPLLPYNRHYKSISSQYSAVLEIVLAGLRGLSQNKNNLKGKIS
jgi:hypothetical protein